MSGNPFGFSNTNLNALASIPKTPTGPALETEPSNLEKFLDVINKPGAIERQMALNSINGNDLTQGVGQIAGWNENQGVLSNLNNLVTANETYQPTGGDVIQAMRGGEAPDSDLGKAAQGIGGFVMDVLNPVDPLNWLGIGEATEAGKALEMAGTEVPFVKGLLEGNRSLLSLTPPLASSLLHGPEDAILHSPDAVNQAAGNLLQGAGSAIQAIPGVPQVLQAFKRPFEALNNYKNIALSKASNIFAGEGARASGMLSGVAMSRILKDATEEIGEGALERMNPQMSSFYTQQGLNPQQQASWEVRRLLQGPIAKSQNIKDPVMKAYLGKIPTQGPTVPSLSKLAETQGSVYKSLYGQAKQAGLDIGKQEGFSPLSLSSETKQRMEQLGVNVEHGDKVLREFTASQAEAMARDPELRAKLYGQIIGTDAITKNPHILDAIKQADPKAANIYEDDNLKTFENYVHGTSNDIATSDVLHDMLSNPSIARINRRDWDGSGIQSVAPVDIPSKFQGVLKKITKGKSKIDKPNQMWVPSATAHEMRNFMGLMTNADQMNRSVGAFEASWRTLQSLYKKTTLLTPLGGLHTAFRDHIGNHFQSWLRGAWSSRGNAIAAKLMTVIHNSKGNPEKFIQEAAKLGKEFGLDLSQEIAIIKNSNLLEEGFTHNILGTMKFNKLERAMGMQQISKLREMSEQFSRTQHYITRRLQGWSPTGAVNDTRKALYDYTNLPTAVRTAQNFMPWVAWSYNNIPAMFEGALRNPGKAFAFYHAKQNIEQGQHPDERALDEYVKGDPHIRVSMDPKTGKFTYVRLKGFLPIADLEDVTSLSKFGDFMQSSLTPYVKSPLENTFNESLFFKTAGNQGAPIEEYPGQTSSFLGMQLQRKDINLLRNIRPLNEVNKLIPGNTPSQLSPASYGLSTAGLNLVPVDMSNATSHARFAYSKQLSNLKLAEKRQQEKGKPTNDIIDLMNKLKASSFQP